jgi:hypothetical protein
MTSPTSSRLPVQLFKNAASGLVLEALGRSSALSRVGELVVHLSIGPGYDYCVRVLSTPTGWVEGGSHNYSVTDPPSTRSTVAA